MKRVKTINNIDMIQCGDYFWEILKENDNSEVFRLNIRTKTDYQKNITLFYGEGVLSVRSFQTTYYGGDYFCFKMKFEDTPEMVKRLLEGECGYLSPIYHKDTIKIKKLK